MCVFNCLYRLASIIFIVVIGSSPIVTQSNEYSVTNYILYRADGDPRNGKVFESIDGIEEQALDGKTVILVHGEGQTPDTKLIQDLKDALIEERQVNVFLVNWTNAAKEEIFMKARIINDIAKNVKDFIVNITYEALVDEEDLHCIGFSVAGHICGGTGHLLRQGASMSLPRISGLAPSVSIIDGNPLWMLSEHDAEFVDVIHTSSFHHGFRRIGDVDFYPNGYVMTQPGCEEDKNEKYLGRRSFNCSQERALELYISSVKRNCEFRSRFCTYRPHPVFSELRILDCETFSEENYGKMGYDSPEAPGRGIQFLDTTDKEPFC